MNSGIEVEKNVVYPGCHKAYHLRGWFLHIYTTTNYRWSLRGLSIVGFDYCWIDDGNRPRLSISRQVHMWKKETSHDIILQNMGYIFFFTNLGHGWFHMTCEINCLTHIHQISFQSDPWKLPWRAAPDGDASTFTSTWTPCATHTALLSIQGICRENIEIWYVMSLAIVFNSTIYIYRDIDI
jgi:hypothetical protein